MLATETRAGARGVLEHGTLTGADRRPITSSASLVAVAWVAACLQAAADLQARRVAISAIPAVMALHLGIVALAVLLVALAVRSGELRGGSSSVQAPAWRLLLSLAALGAAVVARLAISVANPTVAWASPALLVAPILLLIELVVGRGFAVRPSLAALRRFATAWCGVAALALLALTLGPARWAHLDVRTNELGAIGWSVVAVAGAAAARRPRTGIRFALVAMAGLLAAIGPIGAGSRATWPAQLAALLVIGVLLVPAGIVRRVVEPLHAPIRAGRDRLGERIGPSRGVRELPAVAERSGRRMARGAAHTLVRPWRALLGASAPRRARARPTFARRDRIGAALMAAGSLAFVASGSAWAHRVGWQPTGHAATVMARSFDVGTSQHPLVGMITSLGAQGGASHPGPVLFDLLAPLVRVFGLQEGALIGGALASLICWAVAVWAAWRAAGRAAAVAAWVTGALVLAIAALGAVWEANNVSITILAMFATVLASWAAACGVWRAWWWAVALGSLCAQAYLPHGLVVIGPVLWAGLAIAGARQTAPAEARRARQALRVGWGIAVVAWAQPALDVLVNHGGNVRGLAQQISHPLPSVGLVGVPRAVAWISALPPRWGEVTRSFAQSGAAMDFIGGPFVAGTIVAVAIGLAWWRTRRTAPADERQLRIVTLLVVLGACVNLTQLPQQNLHSFQLGWLVVASMCVWFTVALSVGLAVQRRAVASIPRRQAHALRVGALCAGAAVVLAAGLARPSRIEDVKGRAYAVDALVSPTVHQIRRSLHVSGPVLVLGLDTRLNEEAEDTILSNLIVDGLDARVERAGAHYGDRRIADRWTGPMLWVTSGLDPVKPVGSRLAATTMPGWSRARLGQLTREVATIARAARTVRLQSWGLDQLPRYVAGWLPKDPCGVAQQVRRGDLPVAALPPGLLLTLYADGAVVSPRLPSAMQDEVSGIVGQGPIEVWLVDRRIDGPVVGDYLLRDGSLCPPPPASPS